MGKKSWVVGKKLWVMGKKSWVKGRGSKVVGKKSWVPNKKLWVPRKTSWVPNNKSWVLRKCCGFRAKYFHIFNTFLPLECVFFFLLRLSQIYIVLERVKAGFLISEDRFINIITKCG